MTKSPLSDPRLAQFPPVLRQMLDAELAAGNTIEEVASCFPAPPAGAYVKLAKPVTTRPHVKTAELDFYDRNSSLYSGEWTDAKRFYFIIEPPRPPPPEPDMDAIRKASNPAAHALPEIMSRSGHPVSRASTEPDPVVQRFKASMVINYEKWHDGIGYDVDLLKEATAADRKAIEEILLRRSGDVDWRDVEALAALNTEKTRAVLKTIVKSGDTETRGAVLQYAPELVSEKEKTEHLLKALKKADIYRGLSQALDMIKEYHPPEIVEQLFHGVLQRNGSIAMHYAGMLLFIHGKAASPFDAKQRPYLLKFNTDSSIEREKMFRELCRKIDVDADVYLKVK